VLQHSAGRPKIEAAPGYTTRPRKKRKLTIADAAASSSIEHHPSVNPANVPFADFRGLETKAIPGQQALCNRRDKNNDSSAIPTSRPPANATKEEIRELRLQLNALRQGFGALVAEEKLVRQQQIDIAFMFNTPRSTFLSIVQAKKYYFIAQCGMDAFILQVPKYQLRFTGCPREETGKSGTSATMRYLGGRPKRFDMIDVDYLYLQAAGLQMTINLTPGSSQPFVEEVQHDPQRFGKDDSLIIAGEVYQTSCRKT
jgi:hypothetical protein